MARNSDRQAVADWLTLRSGQVAVSTALLPAVVVR